MGADRFLLPPFGSADLRMNSWVQDSPWCSAAGKLPDAARDGTAAARRFRPASTAVSAQTFWHKNIQQRSSTQHSPPLLQPNIDASSVPVRRVRWRRRVTAEHGGRTCKIAFGGQAACRMRRELRKELMPRSSSSRVRQNTGYKRARAHAHARTRTRLQHCLHTTYTRRRSASLTATPDALNKSRSMMHHACSLSAVPLHTSPLAPRTSGWRCSTASVVEAM